MVLIFILFHFICSVTEINSQREELKLFSVFYAQIENSKITGGRVYFISEAPLETISAESKHLAGAINKTSGKFAFDVPMESFMGFNSPLQREHFQENYIEIDSWPHATFSGKIIDPIDWNKQGTQTVRTKGKLSLHGVSRETVIKSDIHINGNIISLKSNFTILLSDYNITIPRLVKQKINEEIKVTVSGVLE